MSQIELAEKCNMERSAMARIEAGKSNMTFFTLCKIAVALNLSIVEVIADAQPKQLNIAGNQNDAWN